MVSPLKETLTISGYTTKPLLLQINNYLNAKSSVLITYSYSAIVPCDGWQPDANGPVNLKKWLKQAFDAMAALFGDIDLNSLLDIGSGSDTLSIKLAVVFATSDTNGDGYLTTDEFAAGVGAVPGIETVMFKGKPLSKAGLKQVAAGVGR